MIPVWQRSPRLSSIGAKLPGSEGQVTLDVPESKGLQLNIVERQVSGEGLETYIPSGTRSVSVFLVNRRTPIGTEDGGPDSAYAFQSELGVRGDRPFVPRPDLHGA